MAAQQPVIDHNDVNDWMTRVKEVVAKPNETILAPAPASASPWHTDLFGCFDPINTCLLTCCCPCVTFGKTHHRLRKSPTLEGYQPINTTCIGVSIAGCFGISFLAVLMQKAEIRQKFGLEGNLVGDCLKACCCGCCTLIQDDKEVAYRQSTDNVIKQEIQSTGGMNYAPQQ